MDNITTLYEEKLNRIENVLNNKVPDRVPVVSLATTWAYYYYGIKPRDSFGNPELNKKVMRKLFSDFYWDGLILTRTGRAFSEASVELLGGGTYTYNKDGIQETKPGSIQIMEDDEYEELIKDPYAYILNKVLPRRYELMRRNDEKRYDDMLVIINDFKETLAAGKAEDEIAIKEFGIPHLRNFGIFNPVDLILDYLRDFPKMMQDVKRRPNLLRDAGLAMVDYAIDNNHLRNIPQKGKVVFIPMHLPQFLSPKDFEKVYWPSYKKITEFLAEKGFKMMFYFERKYEHLFDFLQELTPNMSVGLFEDDDLRVAKKRLGKTMAIAGGMPTNLLFNASKEKCIDYAKSLIDDLAPGGGYMFTTDKILLSPADGKPENIKAVNEFVHSYGIYK